MISFLTRFEWKKHGLFVGGLFLSVYFSYHLLQGPRSILYLQDLEARNVVLEEDVSRLAEERQKQEQRVASAHVHCTVRVLVQQNVLQGQRDWTQRRG